MQRPVPVALILTGILAAFGGAVVTSAQGGPAEIGVPVTITDPEGIIRGSVTINEVADPFTDYDPLSPPAEGTRYVVLDVAFEAASDQTLDAQPYQVVLQDGEGNLYTTQYVRRPADSVFPDLQAQLMSPGNRVSGVIGYVLPGAVTLDRIVYQPAGDRLVDLGDLVPGGGPALGDTVTYTDATGASTMITPQLIDPFTDYDPGSPPAEGTRFVMLQPTFENGGQLPYYADPYDLVLRDAEGRLYGPTNIYRVPGFSVPVLENQTMSPGDRVSGYVGYTVPADAQLADILYRPESARIATLADLVAGTSQPAQPSEPAATAEPTAQGPAPSAPTPAPEASPGTDR